MDYVKSETETGPTYVGDSFSDPELMSYLGATRIREPCYNFDVYKTENCVRVVLDKLEMRGYHVVSCTAMDHQCIWTLKTN
ncbi:GTP cyclohydrolase 1 feedback regulatory protein [Armadillidium vulgare]|nr:GTP cyclohydrolase 1 feedback regulatory protein [Armadillidium vulgare]